MPQEHLSSPALSPIQRPRTTSEEIEERLIIAIARGDKLSGERITEAELATAFRVSRVPAREAMQKLQLRGILVGGEQRGMRVADYSEQRIAELYELRIAVEKIIIQHVMREGRDNSALFSELSEIVARMAKLSDSDDPLALGTADIDFHRAIVSHSGHQLGAQIWEGLAQHLLIFFCRDWSNTADRLSEVRLHKQMIDFLKSGAAGDIDRVLAKHYWFKPSQMVDGVVAAKTRNLQDKPRSNAPARKTLPSNAA
jgi:GntR family transcriptional regulator, rspAB operon transcriptional repressor